MRARESEDLPVVPGAPRSAAHRLVEWAHGCYCSVACALCVAHRFGCTSAGDDHPSLTEGSRRGTGPIQADGHRMPRMLLRHGEEAPDDRPRRQIGAPTTPGRGRRQPAHERLPRTVRTVERRRGVSVGARTSCRRPSHVAWPRPRRARGDRHLRLAPRRGARPRAAAGRARAVPVSTRVGHEGEIPAGLSELGGDADRSTSGRSTHRAVVASAVESRQP